MTLSSSPGRQNASDEAILQCFRDTNNANGATGFSWTVLSEGREVSEVLIFIHEKDLTIEAEIKIKKQLRLIAETKLPGILSDIRNRKMLHSEARAVFEEKLSGFNAELSTSAAGKGTEKVFKKQEMLNAALQYWKAIILGAIVSFVGVGTYTFWPNEAIDVQNGISGPTSNDIRKVAEACYPDIANDGRLDELTQVLKNEIWSEEIEGRHDYSRALRPNLRNSILVKEQKPDALCKARTNLWKQASKIQEMVSKQPSTSIQEVANQLSVDRRSKVILLEVIDRLSQHIASNPFPEKPKDCELGLCMPLVSESEIMLKKNIDEIYRELSAIFETDIDGLRLRLREEEVQMRGELSLLGISPTQILERYVLLWKCTSEEECDLPMYNEPDWLSSK